jgi:preprotein translocase subunit SecY
VGGTTRWERRYADVSAWLGTNLAFGTPLYLALESVLIFGFTYLYNSVQFDPKRIAEQLREAGGFIPGVRPGLPTAEFLGHISSRLSQQDTLGSGVVCVFQFLATLAGQPGLLGRFLEHVGVGVHTSRQLLHLVVFRAR